MPHYKIIIIQSINTTCRLRLHRLLPLMSTLQADLSNVTAKLLLAPADGISCSGAAAEVGLVAAGVVYRFAGPAGLPPWAGTLVDDSILQGARQAGLLRAAVGSEVLVLAHPPGHADDELRLRVLVTPNRLASELARKDSAHTSAAQQAASDAALEWCFQNAEAEEVGQANGRQLHEVAANHRC